MSRLEISKSASSSALHKRTSSPCLRPAHIRLTPKHQKVLQRYNANSNPSLQTSLAFIGGNSERSRIKRARDEKTVRILKFHFASKDRTLRRFVWFRLLSKGCLWVTVSFYQSKRPVDPASEKQCSRPRKTLFRSNCQRTPYPPSPRIRATHSLLF